MTDAKDIRDLTRAMKDLAKAASALNTTLVAIEQNRNAERDLDVKKEEDHQAQVAKSLSDLVAFERDRVKDQEKYCRDCNASVCDTDTPSEFKHCPCCKMGHDTGKLTMYIQSTGNGKP